jgi:hypothetical protein
MATKGAEKRGASQVGPPSKEGKVASPKDKAAPSKAGAPGAEATQEGKVSSPKDKTAPSKAGAPGTEATKGPRAAKGHVPNDETAEVLREAREGKNLLHYDSVEEMYKDLGI